MQLIKTVIRSGILSICTSLALLSQSAHVHAISNLEQGFEAQNNGDFVSAASYFEMAVQAGSSEAQYQLGLLYAEGTGIEKNLAKAKVLMQKSADVEHPLAINWLSQQIPLTTPSDEEVDPEDDC